MDNSREQRKRKRESEAESSECGEKKRFREETPTWPAADTIKRHRRCLEKDIEIRQLRERVAFLEKELRRLEKEKRDHWRTDRTEMTSALLSTNRESATEEDRLSAGVVDVRRYVKAEDEEDDEDDRTWVEEDRLSAGVVDVRRYVKEEDEEEDEDDDDRTIVEEDRLSAGVVDVRRYVKEEDEEDDEDDRTIVEDDRADFVLEEERRYVREEGDEEMLSEDEITVVVNPDWREEENEARSEESQVEDMNDTPVMEERPRRQRQSADRVISAQQRLILPRLEMGNGIRRSGRIRRPVQRLQVQ